MTRTSRVAAVVAALAVVTLAGCSGGGAKSASSTAGGRAATVPQQAGGGDSAQNTGSAPNQVPVDQPVQRSVIYTGAITLRVDDVAGAAVAIEALAVGSGGYVGGDQRQLAGDRSTATLTLRVPAGKFTATMDAIRTKGHEEHEDVSSQDVTGTVIDLDARIQAQQASVNRVRDLLAKAQSITDITTIESELAKREADLESMQAKQANLTDLAALSTITVELLAKDTAAAAAPKPADKGFVAGLKHGWHAFTASVGVLLTILGALLPFLVLAAVLAAVAYWWLRRRRRTRPDPAT
jgi:hypothetical protein